MGVGCRGLHLGKILTESSHGDSACLVGSIDFALGLIIWLVGFFFVLQITLEFTLGLALVVEKFIVSSFF